MANKNFTVKNGLEVGGQEVISSSGAITSAALGGQVLGTSASPSFANITTAGYLRGPASFVIDPAAHGDDTGTVVIAGNLQVDGTQTTINSTTMTVDDLNLTLASGAANAAAANGAGITVDITGTTNPSLVYGSSNDDWTFNKNLNVTGNIGVTGTVDGIDIAARDAILTSTTTTAQAALPKAGGTMTGDLNSNSLIKTTGNITTASAQPTLFLDRGNGSYTWGIYNGGGTDFPTSSFNIANNAGTAVITALDSGNVGIGTDTPGATLDVDDNNSGKIRLLKDGSVRAEFSNNANEGELSLYRSSNAKNVYISSYYDSYFNGGNVGIGTATPSTKLHIAGPTSSHTTLRIQSTSTGYDPTIMFSSPTNGSGIYLDDNDTNKLKFYTGYGKGVAGKEITIDNEAQLGIGTTAPSSPLHVSAAKNDGWLAQLINTGTGSDANGLDIHAGVDSSDYILRVREQDGTDVMAVKYGGKVGIGTTTPTTALTIRKAIASNAYGQQASMIEFKSYFTGYDTETVKSAIYSGVSDQGTLNTEGGYMAFHVNNNGTMAEKLRIEKSGNVGIGTTNPAQPLHVLSSTALTAGVARFQYSGGNDYEVIRVESLGNNDAHIGFFADGDTNYYGGFGIDYSDAGKFKLQTDNLFVGGSNLMTWARDGKVGINNTGPTVNLDVYNGSGWGGIDIDGTSGGELRFQKAGTNYGQIYGNDSSGFVVNALSGLEELSLQAGSTILLYLKKSTNTVLVRQGILKTSTHNASIKKTCNFSHGVANQKVDFYIQPNYWGNITVSITASYSNQNAPGVLTKQFGVGLNPSGNIYSNESKITEELGFTAGNFAISDIVWDASPADSSGIGKYKFTIVHRVSSGNACELTITGNSADATSVDKLCAMTQSAVYTTDTTVYNKQTRDVAFFSTAAAQVLNSTATKVNFNTDVFDEGSNMSNGVFTAPQKGVYTFHVNYLVYPHNNGTITSWFYLNGSQYGPGVQCSWQNGSHTQISNGTLINLEKGNTVEHRAAIGGFTGSPAVYAGQNCFFGHLI